MQELQKSNSIKINLLICIFIFSVITSFIVATEALDSKSQLVLLCISTISSLVLSLEIFKHSKNTFNFVSALTILASVFLGIWVYLFHDSFNIHFNSKEVLFVFNLPVFITFSSLLGRYVDINTRGSLDYSLNAIKNIKSSKATVFKSGVVKSIDISEVALGDILIVKPGEVIPLDGTITVGKTSIDESRFTGESLPVSKKHGDFVIGGSINRTSNIQVTVEKLGNDTLLSQIHNLVIDAESQRVWPKGLRDLMSIEYMIVVFPLALLTSLAIYYYYNNIYDCVLVFLSILTYSFPLAAEVSSPLLKKKVVDYLPTLGFKIKDQLLLELAPRLNYFAFGKTGILTKNRPQVASFIIMSTSATKYSKSEILDYAYALERKIDHPLSLSLIDYLKNNSKVEITDRKVSEFQYYEGRGIKGVVSDSEVLIGNFDFLHENNIYLPQEAKKAAEGMSKMYRSIYIGVSINKEIVSVICFTDSAREEVINTIKYIKNKHIVPMMITADVEASAKGVSAVLGIDETYYGLSPSEKLSKIHEKQSLSRDRKLVAMIGDGVNDAPAMAASDIGIALSKATDVVLGSADLVLTNGIDSIQDFMEYCAKIYPKLRDNLLLIFITHNAFVLLSLAMIPLGIFILKPEFYFVVSIISLCGVYLRVLTTSVK